MECEVAGSNPPSLLIDTYPTLSPTPTHTPTPTHNPTPTPTPYAYTHSLLSTPYSVRPLSTPTAYAYSLRLRIRLIISTESGVATGTDPPTPPHKPGVMKV